MNPNMYNGRNARIFWIGLITLIVVVLAFIFPEGLLFYMILGAATYGFLIEQLIQAKEKNTWKGKST